MPRMASLRIPKQNGQASRRADKQAALASPPGRLGDRLQYQISDWQTNLHKTAKPVLQ